MKRLSLFSTSAAAVAGLSAGAAFALLRRLVNNTAVVRAGTLPVTPVPRDTVSATAVQEPQEPQEPGSGTPGLPSRTWIVDNSDEWDGSPQELVVPAGTHRKADTPHP